VQKDFLAANPSARLRIFAVWFRIWPTDERSSWPADLLTDPRVIHLWDEKKSVGNWYGSQPERTARSGGTAWDAYFAYRADSVWEERPAGLAGWGSPIIRNKEQFARDLRGLLGRRQRQGVGSVIL
jgi:hypothetical protein